MEDATSAWYFEFMKAKKLEKENQKLKDALSQILGWRELRSGNEFPIERIEKIAREALKEG